MQVNPKKLIAINFLIILVLSIGMYAFASTPTSTVWISPGIYPTECEYVIFKDGSNYFAKDGSGQIDYSGTNATDVIQDAIDNMPANSKMALVGAITLDGQIGLKSNMELDLTKAYVKQGRTGSSYSGIIHVQSKSNIYIHGGKLDGNKAGGTTNHGIVIESIHSIPFTQSENVTVENVEMYNVNGSGIVLLNGSYCMILNNYLTNIGNPATAVGPAIRIDDVSSYNFIFGNTIDTTEEHGIKDYATTYNNTIQSNTVINTVKVGISIEGDYSSAKNNYLENCGTGGSWATIFAAGDYASVIGNTIVSANYYGISLYNSSTCVGNDVWFASYGILAQYNCTVTGNSLTDITNYGIHIVGHDNTVSGNTVNRASRGLKLQTDADYNSIVGGQYIESTWGIQIDSGCDYNIIIGVSTRHSTNGIIDAGSNNHINLCWNITTWIS